MDTRQPASPPPRPSYGWAAFANVYNLTLLAGGLAASALTLNPAPALLALGMEGLWLSVGTALPAFRRRVDARHAQALSAWEQERLRARLDQLPEALSEHYWELDSLCEEILELAETSDRAALLGEELTRLEPLKEGWLNLALEVQALTAQLERADVGDLEMKLGRQRKAAAQLRGEAAALAQRNLEVLTARQDAIHRLRERLASAREQMKLVTSTLELMRDELGAPTGAPSPHAPLGEVLAGLEAARQTLSELEPMNSGD